MRGLLRGGQQPVSGSRIYMYVAGVAGAGPAVTDLLAPSIVTTDSSGNFVISSYTCPSSTSQVYLVARGGNPGLARGTNNSALVLLAALGSCGGLSSQTAVSINEATTVASAWALAQFLSPGAMVQASPTNATGLQNAFQTVPNLINTVTGAVPGPGLPKGSVTEPGKLNALANALAGCVSSNGGVACSPLFAASTVAGVVPANTLDAALNIVRNPGAQVNAVFSAITGSPFQPTLAIAPNDWTMSITYGGCSNGCGGLSLPGEVAIDSTGSVWVPNYFGGVVSKFLPNGAPAAPQGYSGVGLKQSFGVAVDSHDNIWIGNENSVRGGTTNSSQGSISKFSSGGTELSGYGYTGGGVYYPQGLASDTAGRIWSANYGDSSASLLANDGTPLSGASGFGYSQLPFTPAVAVDATGNAWFAIQQGAAKVTPAGVVFRYPCCSYPAGVAVDQGGNVWLADYGGASLIELDAAGSPLLMLPSPNGSLAAQGIAVDGTGRVWAANFRGNSLTAVAGSSGAVLSPANGFGADAPLNEPRGVAIDASGNLWTSNYGGDTLTQFVGLASPVKTPLLGPPVAP